MQVIVLGTLGNIKNESDKDSLLSKNLFILSEGVYLPNQCAYCCHIQLSIKLPEVSESFTPETAC